MTSVSFVCESSNHSVDNQQWCVTISYNITSIRKNYDLLSLNWDHRKSRETREAAYTCRYTSGHLIPTSVYTHDWIMD